MKKDGKRLIFRGELLGWCREVAREALLGNERLAEELRRAVQMAKGAG